MSTQWEGVVAPPQNLEAEQSVLGTIFLSEVALTPAIEEGIRPEHFYRWAHGEIFRTMMKLQSQGESVDSLTVVNYLASEGLLEKVGGRVAVDILSGSVPAVGNFRSYCRIVVEKYRWRCRAQAAYKQVTAVTFEHEDDYSRALADAEQADDAINSSFVDPAENFMKWIESKDVGIPTPFEVLTKAIGGGFLPGDVTVFGGWPGHGKTILADMCVLTAFLETKSRCHIYFNEMAAHLRTARMLSRMTSVPWWDIRDKNLNSANWTLLLDALNTGLPAAYERIEGWGVDEIVRHIRRHRWDLAVVDTASRIPARDVSEIKYVSGALANVARETNCHIIEVLQLNLERSKGAARPTPTGRDLLGGGSWFQDARNVIFVHRSQEKIPGLDDASRVLLDGIVLCDKATHGEPEKGFVPVSFVPRKMTFVERESGDEQHPRASDSPSQSPSGSSGDGMPF